MANLRGPECVAPFQPETAFDSCPTNVLLPGCLIGRAEGAVLERMSYQHGFATCSTHYAHYVKGLPPLGMPNFGALGRWP